MNKYVQYVSFDFAQDASFIRWVHKSNTEDEAFWSAWINSNPERKEEVEKAITLVQQVTFKKEAVENEIEERVWSGINKSVTKDDTTNNSNPKRTGKIIRLASIAAVAAMAIFFLMVGIGNDYNTITETEYAKTKTITLPDGSIVYLNADSKLSYNDENWSDNRLLNLEGEAFFEVKKGSQFKVETEKGHITVLGTSFNVYQRSKEFKVFCKTGKVSVFAAKKSTILTPNQSVSVPDKIHEVKKNINPSDNRSNWKEGIYTYRNETVEEVAKELERQLGLNISIPDELKIIQYTGSFSITDKETALAEVFWPLDMDYVKEDGNITILKKRSK